jgi:hypothetical protein
VRFIAQGFERETGAAETGRQTRAYRHLLTNYTARTRTKKVGKIFDRKGRGRGEKESREQRAESREQRAESRGQRAEGRKWKGEMEPMQEVRSVGMLERFD